MKQSDNDLEITLIKTIRCSSNTLCLMAMIFGDSANES